MKMKQAVEKAKQLMKQRGRLVKESQEADDEYEHNVHSNLPQKLSGKQTRDSFNELQEFIEIESNIKRTKEFQSSKQSKSASSDLNLADQQIKGVVKPSPSNLNPTILYRKDVQVPTQTSGRIQNTGKNNLQNSDILKRIAQKIAHPAMIYHAAASYDPMSKAAAHTNEQVQHLAETRRQIPDQIRSAEGFFKSVVQKKREFSPLEVRRKDGLETSRQFREAGKRPIQFEITLPESDQLDHSNEDQVESPEDHNTLLSNKCNLFA